MYHNNQRTIMNLTSSYSHQQGFTLVELMIALVLGLLVSAAAIQIFLTSSVNARRQEAGSEIQENSVFGFSDFQYHLRRANYGARPASTVQNEFFMNHNTPQGGIVLTAPTGVLPAGKTTGKWATGNLYGLKLKGAKINDSLLTRSASNTSVSNLAGTASNSDQLTVQYKAGLSDMYDCQGALIPENYYVIERYFVRRDTTTNQNGLACASAIYQYDDTLAGAEGIDISQYTKPGETSPTTNNLDGNGTIIIPGVDYFRVLLAVSSKKDFATRPDRADILYIPIPSGTVNLNNALNNRRIVGLQLGLLTHSTNPVSTGIRNQDIRFDILDKNNAQLNSASQAGPTYLYNTYESSILFRNARGGV